MDCVIQGTKTTLIIFASLILGLILAIVPLVFVSWNFTENPNWCYVAARALVVIWIGTVSITCAEKKGWFK